MEQIEAEVVGKASPYEGWREDMLKKKNIDIDYLSKIGNPHLDAETRARVIYKDIFKSIYMYGWTADEKLEKLSLYRGKASFLIDQLDEETYHKMHKEMEKEYQKYVTEILNKHD